MLGAAPRERIGSACYLDDQLTTGRHSALRGEILSRRYGKYSRVRACVLFFGDMTAFFCSSILVAGTSMIDDKPAGWSVAYDRLQQLGMAWHGWATLVVLVVLLSHLSGRGHYTQRVPFWTELGDLVRCSFIALLLDFVLATKIYAVDYSTEAVLRWALFVPLVIAIRSLGRLALDRAGLGSLRTIIVGDPAATDAAAAALSSEKALGYTVVGIVPFDRVSPSHGPSPWLSLMEAHGADFVVVACGRSETTDTRNVLESLTLTRVPFAVIPAVGGLPVFGFEAQYFFSHDVMLLVNRNNLTRPFNRAAKLAFDYVVGLLMLIAFLPAFALIALLIKRDGGPVFFRQQRIGAFGVPFTCLKFRSMVLHSDEVLRDLLEQDPAAAAEWAGTQKLRRDPRVTPIGRFLRATSLDELPQLLNVLRGEMSLVGPRPIIASEAARYGNNLGFYTDAKPGVTGLWQVSGRSDTSYERRVELDVWYVKNWTLWHDVAILLKTLPTVVWRKGAV